MEIIGFNERTKLAAHLAKRAGAKIESIQNEDLLNVKEKGTKDILTSADIASEEIITNGIRISFPNDNIVAEEKGDHQIEGSDFSWIIDPLDGTINFSRRIPSYCVSVGYMKNGLPEGGAIFIPKSNELFVCEKGKGAYCNERKIFVSNVSAFENSLATIGFNNRYAEMVSWHTDIHTRAMYEMQNVEKLFSTIISLCYVADGRTEAHMEIYCYLWDICVGSLLVEEAGGKVTAPVGKNIDFSFYEKQCIVASNGLIHDKFINLVGRN